MLQDRVPRSRTYSAVVGSMSDRTCETLLAGNPPQRACSLTRSADAAALVGLVWMPSALTLVEKSRA